MLAPQTSECYIVWCMTQSYPVRFLEHGVCVTKPGSSYMFSRGGKKCFLFFSCSNGGTVRCACIWQLVLAKCSMAV